MTYLGAPLMSVEQSWGTPPEFMEFMKECFNFLPTLDAAASEINKKAPHYFSEEQNSLEQEWFGNVWLNPPFGKVLLPAFLDKCNEQIQSRRVNEIFVLIPARTDTKWFHEKVIKGATEIFLIKGRFNFTSPNSATGANAPFPSMLVRYTKWPKTEVRISPLEVPANFRGWTK